MAKGSHDMNKKWSLDYLFLLLHVRILMALFCNCRILVFYSYDSCKLTHIILQRFAVG